MVLDHVVLAVPDLAGGVAWFQGLTGVRPPPGGSHLGLGTANCLVGLGGAAYLEIIGPDPGQPDPARPRPFGIDDLVGPRVVTWCVRPPDLDRAIAAARASGHDPGAPSELSRRTAEGGLLTWRMTPFATDPADELVPFLIDWGTTPHPTTADLPTLPLRSLAAEHPDPARIRTRLDALGVDLPVLPGRRPRLVVTVEGPGGPLVLG